MAEMFLPIRLPSDPAIQHHNVMNTEPIGGLAGGSPMRTPTGSGSMGYLRRPQDKMFKIVGRNGHHLNVSSIDIHARYTQKELDQMFEGDSD